MFKRINRWILRWAETEYGAIALFILAIMESVFFPLLPDFLMIPLILAATHKAYKFAAIGTVGSIIGATLGYLLGHILWLNSDGSYSSFANFFFNHIPGFSVAVYEKIQALYKEWNFWVIFAAGFAPIPYKIFTITAGVFNIGYPMFLLASIIGRGARFFIIAWLLKKYGERVNAFFGKHHKLILVIIAGCLVIGFFVIKFIS